MRPAIERCKTFRRWAVDMTTPLERLVPWSVVAIVGAFLIVGPVVTVAPNMWPVDLATPQWRFGSFGFLLSSLVLPTLGIALLLWAGVLKESRRLVRGVAVMAGVAAAVVTVLLVVFLKDGMALSGQGEEAPPAMFWAALTRTGLISGLSIPVLAVLAVAGIRTSRLMPTAATEQPGNLVIGR